MRSVLSAQTVFSLEIVDPPRWRRWLANAMNAPLGRSSSGYDSAYCYGSGQRAIIRRRASGEVVGEFVQALFPGPVSKFAVVLADHSDMSAEDFERVWLS